MKSYVSFILLLILSSFIAKAQQKEKGITTFGTSVVTETVRDIMARQIIGAQPVRQIEAEKEKIYPDRGNLPQDPNSPIVSQYGLSNEKVNQHLNTVTSLSKGINFTGATLGMAGYVPPDNMGSVGPTQYIVAINGIIVSYNKTTGAADGVLNMTTDNFFLSVTTSGGSTSDPHIRYDRLSKKWYFVIIDIPTNDTDPNRMLLAVSADSIITSLTPWNFFYYQNSGSFIDYPTLGIDANALYIGGNLFGLGAAGSFMGGIQIVVQKSSIQGSGPMVSTKFNFGTSTSGIFTAQGVDNLYDPAVSEGYFIGVDQGTRGRLNLIRVTNPGSTSPTLTNVTITVPTTAKPSTLYSKPGSASYNLDPDDDRLFAAMIRNGHLWTAHHIETTNAGVGSSSGTRISARWYDLVNFKTGSTPALNQSGTLYSSSLTSTRDKNYVYPTITVNGQGHALMGFTTAGYYNYAQAGYTFRLNNATLGTMQTPDSNTTSTTSYTLSDETSPHRWGDYSMTECDPSDDMTFWTIQQFCDATNSYGCRVTQLKAPAPATLITATPNVLGPGSNLTLVIKGDTTTGLGFFEPGLGFSKHLSASIDGGITVNSITYVSPGTLTLNVTTTGSTIGARNVTITNPDGQIVSSGTILTYQPVTGPLLAVTPSSLTGFNYSLGYGPSLSQSYNLSGTNLTGFPGSITVSAPNNFEVSLDDINFAASQLVSFTSATLSSTTIHIRLKSGLSISTYTIDVTNAGGGASNQIVSCSGVVNPVPSPIIVVSPGTLSGFSYSSGTGPSVNKSYSLSGTYLTPSSGSITVQCLTNYEVSTDGTTFSGSISQPYTAGALPATTIYVRLKSGLSIGNYNSEIISNAGGGASIQNVICSGVVNDVTSLFTDDFNYTVGTFLTADGWTAHNGAGTNPPSISSPGLTYSNYAGSGVGNAVTLSGNGEDDNHPFTSISSGSLYASAMINVTSASSSGDYFFHFAVSTSTFNARVFVKSATGGFVFGVSKSSNNIQWSPQVLATGTNNFIVLKYTFVSGSTNDKAELFINPSIGGSEPASDLSSVITDADFTAIDKICLRQSSTTPIVILDGIRVGQTWASVTPTATSTLTLSAYLEGCTNSGGTAMRNDHWPITVTVELHNSISPYALVESKAGVLNTAGVGNFIFTTVANATPYYIVIKSVNTLETWSAAPQSFTSGALSYNFSTAQTQAYGSNMVLKGSTWCIYSGDVVKNATNIVDGSDMIAVDNDNTYGVTDNAVTDMTGDGIVDGRDVINVDNNNTYGISRQAPDGAPMTTKHVMRPVITPKQNIK